MKEAAMARMRPFVRSALGLAGAPLEVVAERVARRWRVDGLAAERYSAETPDGWSLALHRVRASPRPPLGPVLLQHGLAACHRTFLFPGRSLAAWLADAGFDCWVSDLRGTGASRPRGPVRWDWDIHDYLDQDLPSILETVLSESGSARLQWVGHSMGGVLLFLYGIRHGGDRLSSGVAVASALDYKVGRNGFQELVRYLGLLEWLPKVPLATVYKLYAPFAGRDNGFERFGHYPGNVEREVARAYYASVYHDVSPGVLRSLATTFEDDGFRDREGKIRYALEARRFTVPVLGLAGDRDRQCDPEAVAMTIRAVGSSDKQVRTFGPDHGQKSHYGHFDLIVGRNAPEEVWPVLREWLARHAPPVRESDPTPRLPSPPGG
jgi:alpha-beta hydrolase superfamily lysophospholipase